MSSEAMASGVDRGARDALVLRWPRSMRASAVHLREEGPLVLANGSVKTVVRALVLAAVAGGLFTFLAGSLESDGSGVPETAPRTPRAISQPRRPASVPPVVALARRGGEVPLDSDFSLEHAALTWSHRVEEGEANPAREAAPSVLRFGPVRVNRSVAEGVVQAAKTTGSDPALLMAIADKESSFAPSAKASTSSASGLFQFIDSTWFKAMRLFGWRHGQQEAAKAIQQAEDESRISRQKRSEILKLRNDPYLSAALAAEMLKRDGDRIAERLGRPLTPGETYLIHFLGPEDAERFMKKMDEAPNASAARLLPKPARANKPIFYARKGRRMKDKSVGEVHAAFEAMMGQRSKRYQDIEDRLPSQVSAYTD